MTQKIFALLVLSIPSALATYTYDWTDPLTTNQSTQYYEVNPSYLNFTPFGLTSDDSGGYGGSLIWKNTSLGNNYEVKATLSLASTAGVYISYLRASSNAKSGPGIQGTFYSVEIQNPTFSSGGNCSATMIIVKSVNGNFTIPVTTTVPCHNGMVVRSVYTVAYGINVYIDNVWYAQWIDGSPITSGQPGIGVRGSPTNNYISSVSFGHISTTAPGSINLNQMGVATYAISPSTAEVDLQWQPPTDAGGTGIGLYDIVRNSTFIDSFPTAELSDLGLALNTTYTYTIYAIDFHWNVWGTSFTVTTPGANDIDFRRVGVKPGGSYWGGGGENIDMRSGNLNFTMPLLKANGRGWTVPFSLSYNSQNWREDPSPSGPIDWNLGRDVGFGYGWKLQGGSLTPYYSSRWVVDQYLFRDSTGAEYHLNRNNGGIWTSTEPGLYVEYDTTVSPPRLYFPDGTFWVFGCTAAGTEQDAGTMYPTLIEDSNGNEVTLTYGFGTNAIWTNSSGRMANITDINGTYNFTYNTDAIPHLTAISSTYGANYSFAYVESVPLASPISQTSFGTSVFLWTVTSTTTQLQNTFYYNWNPNGQGNPGELTQAVFPYGGYLKWTYNTTSYTSSRSQREVGSRILAMSSGATELTYPISYTGTQFHTSSTVTDAGGLGQKQWYFDSIGDAGEGLQQFFLENSRTSTSNSFSTVSQTQYTWTPDSLSRPYISTATTTLDGTAQKKTTQQLDQYGNVTSMNLYDFGASSPTRTYTNTYLTDASGGHPSGSNYNAEHIRNRILTSAVTQNGQTATLVSNSYDFYNPSTCGATQTPQGWINIYPAGMIDLTNTNNVFRGNVTTSNGLDMTHNLCYGTTGAVVARTDGGHTTTTQTDSTTNYTAPTAITVGSLTNRLSWDALLQPTGQTGPNGDTTSIGYDAAARPHKTTTPYGAYTTYTYSISPAQNTAVVSSSDPNTNGRKTVTKLDGLGRTIEADSIDAGGTTRSIVQTQYAPCGCSPLGKLLQRSQPYKPGDTVYWTVYTYDGLGRTTKVVAPDGSTTTYSYSGNTVTVTQPGPPLPAPQVYKIFTMDAFGNLTSVVEPDISQTNTNNQATSTYTYDAMNHLIGVSMPRRMPGNNVVTQTRTFNYLNGTTITAYLQSAQNPENGTVSYTYNGDGTLATRLDAKGQTLKYAYDTYGRVLTVSLASSPDTVLRTYTYDTNTVDSTYSPTYTSGRLTTVTYGVPSTSIGYNNGQQVHFTGDTVTEEYSYTQPGQVAGKRMHLARQPSVGNPLILNLDATWNYTTYNEGHLMGVTYPGNPNGSPSYNYTYDGMGRLNTMTDGNSNTLVSGTTYNAAGQMLSGVDTRTYNSMGQLTSVASGSTLNITYTYPTGQNFGKIASQHDNVSGETVSYQYDTLNRLTSATGSGWNQSFVYDPFGNLTDKNGTYQWHGVPDANTNHLYTVDANGNTLSTPSVPGMGYDPENRLVAATNGYQQYAYDGQNKRIWAVSWDNTHTFYTSETYYFYSPDGKLMGQFTPSYSNGTFSFINGPTRSYFGGRMLGAEDRLGSRGTYYPYGEARPQNPSDGNVGFATYTWDSATGLNYADQRYYSSAPGRFMTPDRYRPSAAPATPQSWNRYAYVQADPINGNDPTGLIERAPDSPCDDPDDPDPFCDPDFPGPPPPPQQPSEPDPLCSISLWERPTPSNGPFVGKGEHTYIYVTDSEDYPGDQATDTGPGMMIEGGPIHHKLTGQMNPPGEGLARLKWNASNPLDTTVNVRVGIEIGRGPICDKIINLLNDVANYNSGPKGSRMNKLDN